MLYLQLVLNGLVQGLVIGLGALAITLVFGIARFANAATGDFLTAGSYGALAAHKATGSLLVEVENLNHLTRIIKAVRKVKGITDVARRERITQDN